MKRFTLLVLLMAFLIPACEMSKKESVDQEFKYLSEQFADLKILRYKIHGFEELPPQQKELLYYLYEAALSGRDIFWDQNFKNNLFVRRTLENIVETYSGDRNAPDFAKFMVYTKRIWFSSGIHHHYSQNKIMPDFSESYFSELVKNSDANGFPVESGETVDDLMKKIVPILFDPKVAAKKVNLDPKADLVKTSATNFYEGVSQKEVESFYGKMIDPKDPTPISYGLNSKVMKENGKIIEKVWKIDGMYGPAIEKIVYWLEKAVGVAENDQQKLSLEKLIEYYKTGDLRTFDEYSIAWALDVNSRTDVVNGFIETYDDPLSYKASFESGVSIKDMEATKRIDAIGKEAQWFEDHSSIMDEHKKKDVKGITAKVITMVVGSGAMSPNFPIGINLPNANWIRKDHGSKSVTLGNIIEAQGKAGGKLVDEFYYSDEDKELAKKYSTISHNLHVDMHEVIGHASGQINPGIGTPKETLKNYASTLEEARADLVGLYFGMDQKLVDIGVMPNLDVGKEGYNNYIANGLVMQLRRIKPGEVIEESHMRNRQLVAKWALEKGAPDNVIEKKVRDGKTYYVINDYQKLREIFGELLKEIQRIKSEGDYEAGKNLVENYGVQIDVALHKEVLERFSKLGDAPYSGCINPKLVPVMEGDKIVDVKVEYPMDFSKQMLEYAKNHSYLPTYN